MQRDTFGPHTLSNCVGLAATHASVSVTPPLTVEGAKLAKKLELDAILHASGDPDEASARSLLRTRQVTAFITKNPCLEGADPAVRQKAASDKFFDMMEWNRITNKRLKFYLSRPMRFARKKPLVARLLSTARLELTRLLGFYPSELDWEHFESAKVFSNGSVQGIARHGSSKDVDVYAKLLWSQTITGSSRCLKRYGPILLDGQYGLTLRNRIREDRLTLRQSEASQACCVPKDATVDRFIAIEPLLNAMAQQGIRSMLDPYLKRWGISLVKQERNVKLAKYASTLGFHPAGLSTIDLSSASDTITIELVKYLLPGGWFTLLDDARTRYVEWEGASYTNESFSTMGNAFTFPLQCLIFASLVRAAIALTSCSDQRWRVYGDDIICPTSASMLLLEALRFSGFIPNETKSFVVGFFRESCGGDFLGGLDVRPVYLKEDIDKLSEKHSLFNRLQRKIPEHPVLPYLYESVRRPFVGPAIGPAGGETSHFVAPTWYLRQLGRCTWNSKAQCYKYRYAGLFPSSRKRVRRDGLVRYLCALLANPGKRHDIRGTQSLSVAVRFTTTPWIEARCAPFWYSL